jgi:hypothetical protein
MEKKITKNQTQIHQLKENYQINGHYLSENTLMYIIENELDVNGCERNSLFPLNPKDLVQGVHYYIESGKWVFTEFYHLLRGNCCKSGCRHCVYGPKKKI